MTPVSPASGLTASPGDAARFAGRVLNGVAQMGRRLEHRKGEAGSALGYSPFLKLAPPQDWLFGYEGQ